MATLDECANQVLIDCGSPPPEILSFNEVTDWWLSSLDIYLQQLAGTDQFHAGVSASWTPSGKIGQADNADGMNVPEFIERQVDASNDRWEDVPIVNISDINYFEDLGKYVVAFYNYPVINYRFSWDPTVNGDVFRRWHDPDSGNVDTMEYVPPLPRTFLQMVSCRTRLYKCFPKLLLKGGPEWERFVKASTDAAIAELRSWEEQFESYCYESKDRGEITREPYNAGRQQDWQRGGFYPFDS